MNSILDRLNINPEKIKLKNKVKIITSNDDSYIVKDNNKQKKDVYKYLENRNFLYFPKVYTDVDENYEVTRYIDEIDVSREQKLIDMIYLLTLLHNKTTFYKEINLDEIKNIYESNIDYFNYLKIYYEDINKVIENEIYMSPSNYLLIRNITNIYSIINIGYEYTNKWYETIKNKKTIRYVLNHNNLNTNHFLEDNNNMYFISWDKSDFGYNVNDIYNLYLNNYQNIELSTILNLYMSKYKLEEYEYYYLIMQLCNIDRIDFSLKESIKIRNIYNMLDYITGILEYILYKDSNKPNDK